MTGGSLAEIVKKADKHQKEIYERLTSQQQKLRKELASQDSRQRQELSENIRGSVTSLSRVLSESISSSMSSQNDRLLGMEERLKTFSVENEQKLSQIRVTMEQRLDLLREQNNRELEQMRTIVTEKLSRTLDSRMTESFKLVNDRLEQVYKGLGEMQTLASGVGDLKRVLSNVKTRGILGEIQLGAILREILSPDQYEENAAVRPGSRNVVEFAVKIPSGNGFVYLPIDSKFPGDTYAALKDACDSGDRERADFAAKSLVKVLRLEAKDIHDKYICPPNTTDFAIMFLPFEGLYAEAVNRGLVEILQREYKVNIAGPSTMAALLNSLQMGFRTLAIEKRSGEVFKLLEEVSAEFDTFERTLTSAQEKLRSADNEIEKLVGVRTRQMQRRLAKLSDYSDDII
ncbi:MAG: DNA recombination protein RmuC [Clostridia bacterium]|nr:DNA recombination protein RmuC [Clostridia bacterium]